jgi:hypothetical protein
MRCVLGRTATACGVLFACAGVMTGNAGAAAAAERAGPVHATRPAGDVEAWQPTFAAPSIDGVGAPDRSLPDSGETSCAGTSYCAMAGIFVTGRTDSNITAYVWDRNNGSWDVPRQVPGLGALNVGGDADANGVSCAAPGDCAAGGFYSPSRGSDSARKPWVASEVRGVWQPAQNVAGLPGPGSIGEIDRLSCAAPGDCTAAGEYYNEHQRGMFAVAETGGRWGSARTLPSISAIGGTSIESLSCPSRGNCAAVGSDLYGDGGNAFVIDEANGTWHRAMRVRGMPAGVAGLAAVSCASAGNCTAVGSSPAPGTDRAASEVTETGGRWGAAHALPGVTASSVSCPANGDCAVVTAGNSAENGSGYVPATGDIVDEVNGVWRRPLGTPDFVPDTVSCSAPGYCSASGYYELGDVNLPYESAIGLIDEVAGAWGPWNVLRDTLTSEFESYAVIDPLSCGAPGNCAMHGYYDGQDGPTDEWAAAKSLVPATTTTLVPPSTPFVFGHRQAARFGVTVLASSGTAAGGVGIMTELTTLCSVRLAAGSGGCTLPATLLHPGDYQVAAYYGISAGFAPSHSGQARLVIVKAGTVTRLTLTHAAVGFGSEQAELFKVSVAPQYAGVPAGTVAVMTGTTTLCKIRLSARKGACSPGARVLKPGRYRLTARYAGNGDYAAARSAPRWLVVRPE